MLEKQAGYKLNNSPGFLHGGQLASDDCLISAQLNLHLIATVTSLVNFTVRLKNSLHKYSHSIKIRAGMQQQALRSSCIWAVTDTAVSAQQALQKSRTWISFHFTGQNTRPCRLQLFLCLLLCHANWVQGKRNCKLQTCERRLDVWTNLFWAAGLIFYQETTSNISARLQMYSDLCKIVSWFSSEKRIATVSMEN